MIQAGCEVCVFFSGGQSEARLRQEEVSGDILKHVIAPGADFADFAAPYTMLSQIQIAII